MATVLNQIGAKRAGVELQTRPYRLDDLQII